VPDGTTKDKDYWGYYNKRGNTTLIPLQTISYNAGGSGTTAQIGGADRNPNPLAVQNGILKRIQFPTGGHSIFDYEPNKYSSVLQDSQLGGGVRIKAIHNFPSEGAEPLVKSYVYGTAESPESGNGFLNSVRPLSFSVQSSKILSYVAVSNKLWLSCSADSRIFTANPTLVLNDYDDTNVCYPFVTEYTGTVGLNIGKQTYSYNWINDLPITPNGYDRPEVETLHWQRGKLLDHKIYETIGQNMYTLKHETINSYDVVNPDTIQNVGILVNQINYLNNATEPMKYDGVQPAPYAYNFYGVRTGACQLISTLEKNFDSPIPHESLTSYRYNRTIQPIAISRNQSDGTEIISRFKYSNDYGPFNSEDDGEGIWNLSNINAILIPVEQTTSVLFSSGIQKLISGQINTFHNNKPLIKDTYLAEPTEPIEGYQPSFIDADGNFRYPDLFNRRINFTDLDEKSNVTHVKPVRGPSKSYIWVIISLKSSVK
jgi:hypothetical protein